MFIHVLKPNKEMQLIILGGAKVKQGAAATLLWYCLCYQLGDSLCLQISEEFFWLLCCLGWCHHPYIYLDCTSMHGCTTFVLLCRSTTC